MSFCVCLFLRLQMCLYVYACICVRNVICHPYVLYSHLGVDNVTYVGRDPKCYYTVGRTSAQVCQVP